MISYYRHRISRCLIQLIAVFILSASVYGQLPPGAPTSRDIKLYDDHLTITGYEGGPFVNAYINIEGTPYFPEHFCPASLKLKKGKEYKKVMTRLNLYTNEISLLDTAGKEFIVADGIIGDVSLHDTTGGGSRLFNFRSGYPVIDKNNTFCFYQVLSDGKLQFLKHTSKEIDEQKNIQSGEVRKEFITREAYYVYSNGLISKLKKEKQSILELMKDEEQKINEYLNKTKVNFKKEDDLSTLFNYYNSLKAI